MTDDVLRIEAGNLTVRVTQKPHLLEQAQKLRYDIFFGEMGGIPDNSQVLAQKRDFDEYDAVCDHLIVQDEDKGGQVIATYRLLRRGPMQKIGRFYSEKEFDVTGIKQMDGEVMELGRSCVHADYRSRAAMQLLFHGIGAYVMHFDIKLLFGCASFNGVDPQDNLMGLSFLHHMHQTPAPLTPKSKHAYEFKPLPIEQVDPKAALKQLPALVKGYLRMNGSFGAGVYIDDECHCVDVAVVVQTELLKDNYGKRYGVS
ncbi:MAG: GNAT family N-acyltransferase [Rickettsiales bacterium]|nr:GNAT family N-acyltransferase [Rickettsiales bacterium]